MTWREALEIVIGQTKHEPYRRLCSNDHPAHEAYRGLMIRQATESAPIPLAESLALLRLVNACPYRSRDAACGCSGHKCALRTASPIVSHIDCLDCVARYE
jgi:hypothetical protein